MAFLDYFTVSKNPKLNPALLWEYDLGDFDWQAAKGIVVQRVIERGWPDDYAAAFEIYGGEEGFREAIKEIPMLSKKDIGFVCRFFKVKKEELKCYTRILSRQKRLGC